MAPLLSEKSSWNSLAVQLIGLKQQNKMEMENNAFSQLCLSCASVSGIRKKCKSSLCHVRILSFIYLQILCICVCKYVIIYSFTETGGHSVIWQAFTACVLCVKCHTGYCDYKENIY